MFLQCFVALFNDWKYYPRVRNMGLYNGQNLHFVHIPLFYSVGEVDLNFCAVKQMEN